MQITPHIYSVHIAENPATFGAMHPGGTQIYFVGNPQEQMVMVDAGEPYRSWTRRILDYYAEMGRPRMAAILITHGHGDHIGGLDRLQEVFDCPVRCHPKLAPVLAERLGADCVIPLRSRELIAATGGVSLRALFTPGHEDDHICYHLPADKALFSGDNILGNSSTSVRNLTQYMASLELMARQNPAILCPGHGQVIYDGAARIRWYIKHRQEREAEVLAALAEGAATVDGVVSAIYPRNLRKNLRPAAARNVATHLAKLQAEGRVAEQPAQYTARE